MSVVDLLKSKLGGEKPQMLFMDIDGVLTVARGSYVLDLDAIRLLRSLQEKGIPVCLVSGNAYPTVLTLQRYLGLSPYFVAENGCVIQVGKELVVLCKGNMDSIVEEIKREFKLEESPSNKYRLCDRAFHIPSDIKGNAQLIRELEKQIMEAFPEVYAYYTGYVLHVYPRECSKSTGMKILAIKLNIDLGKSLAVGDSMTDIDMVKAVGVGVVVGDADEEAKREAILVLPYKASESTKYFLAEVLKYLETM